MKRIANYFILAVLASMLVISCKQGDSKEKQAIVHEGMNVVVAKEALYATNYTYMLVTEDQNEYWIAVPYQEVEIGKTYYFEGKMEMKDFKSKDLDRVFDVIYFVDNIYDTPHQAPAQDAAMPMGRQPVEQLEGLNIEPAKGGIRIADLYANPASYQGKQVILRGQVMKVNEGIMGKNWIHLQDGSSHEGKYDITVTSGVLPKVGNTITLQGTVAVDKDFGAGYFYDVIVEDAQVVPASL
ncbi:MAG: hypothetical protein KA053_03720 [Lentimicrobiaceae bacterium]|nr:hypothetical protein [Lentimicrobiaceae bacterium]